MNSSTYFCNVPSVSSLLFTWAKNAGLADTKMITTGSSMACSPNPTEPSWLIVTFSARPRLVWILRKTAFKLWAVYSTPATVIHTPSHCIGRPGRGVLVLSVSQIKWQAGVTEQRQTKFVFTLFFSRNRSEKYIAFTFLSSEKRRGELCSFFPRIESEIEMVRDLGFGSIMFASFLGQIVQQLCFFSSS